jgi:hypothetical protein
MHTPNTPLPTIPQIAEMLAEHVRRDNDAPRFIVESILPVIGMDFSSVSEALAAPGMPGMLRDSESDFLSITTKVSVTRRKVLELSKVIGSASRDVSLDSLEEAHGRWVGQLGELAYHLDKVLDITDGRDS